MEEANHKKDEQLHKNAMQVFDFAIEAGWDKEYGPACGDAVHEFAVYAH